MKKLFTFLLLSILTIGMSWAIDSPYSTGTISNPFGAKVNRITNGDVTLGSNADVTWALTAEGTASDGVYTGTSKGWQIGSGNNPATSVVLSTSAFKDYTITSIKAVAGSGNEDAVLKITAGNSSKEFTLTSTIVTCSFDNVNESGDVTLTFTNTAKALYLRSLTIEFQQGATVTLASPSFSLESGVVSKNSTVTLSAEEGAKIYYTVDGTDPTVGSTIYTDAITIDETKTIKAIAAKDDLVSSVASRSYEVIANPVFSVAEGTVAKGVSVGITEATNGAAIYYTTNGDEPTAESTQYSAAIKILESQTIKAVAILGNAISDVVTAKYTVEDVVIENGNIFTLVKAGETITEGKYVIVSADGVYAAGTVSDKRMKAIATANETFTVVNDKVVLSDNNTSVSVLELKSKDGNWELWQEGAKYPILLQFNGSDVTISNVTDYNNGRTQNSIVVGTYNNLENVARISSIYSGKTSSGKEASGQSRTLSLGTLNSDVYFRNFSISTLKAEQEVRLYKQGGTLEYKGTLAEMGALVAEGESKEVTVTDLTGVEVVDEALYAKGTSSEITKEEGTIDYMAEVYGQANTKAEWTKVVAAEGVTVSFASKLKKELGDVKGTLSRDEAGALTFTIEADPTTTDGQVALNTFVPCNFYSENVQEGTNKKNYFFTSPQTNEIAYVAYAVCDEYATTSAHFTTGENDGVHNSAGLKGDFNADLTLTSEADKTKIERAYNSNGASTVKLYVLVTKVAKSSDKAPALADVADDATATAGFEYSVIVIGVEGDVITGVTDVNAAKEVAKVVYYNVAGVESAEPFQGVNIVKTVYTDGTSSVAKTVK